MSLGIIFKGPEGLVLAADSRVTLTAQLRPQGVPPGQPIPPPMLLPATFDNATKLLKVKGQEYIGAVTYGAGAIGQAEPRTAHSFLPEFEAQLRDENPGRMSVEEFAKKLSDFYMTQWRATMPSPYTGADMIFLIGGFNEGAVYGRVFELFLPSRPDPHEQLVGTGSFGAVWGGQREFVDRLLQGYDPGVLHLAKAELTLNSIAIQRLQDRLAQLAIPIPYQFLPLQDCVDLSTFLIRTTITLQQWQIGVRGVGGAIDVATITQTDGFQPVQQKKIRGESVT